MEHDAFNNLGGHGSKEGSQMEGKSMPIQAILNASTLTLMFSLQHQS